jgi:glycosyltransferase involved in cell wall biosynthesis
MIRAFWSRLERGLIRKVHRIITVSDSIARILQTRYQLEEVTVLRNLPMYQPPVQSDRIRAELDLSSDRPIVLYQGGFLTDNGLSEQIEAAASFREAVFVLIGDGPCETELKRQVQESGLQEKVFFIPRVPFQELHFYTCAADLGLCLIKGTGRSFYYSMPNKLFEYLMAGLPVLASDFPEMRKVISETGAGQVIDPRNQTAIGPVACQMLSDERQRRAYREAALKAARQYNWERESAQLIQLYECL